MNVAELREILDEYGPLTEVSIVIERNDREYVRRTFEVDYSTRLDGVTITVEV